MERRDNYAIAAAKARSLFANYDHEAIAIKLRTELDATYLYTFMLGERYRIRRTDGDISRFHNQQWIPANSFEESLTLLDLVCDSSPNRQLSYRWKSTQDFGRQVHQNLLGGERDPQAEYYEKEAAAFTAACEALGGVRYHLGDIAYSFDVFEGMRILVQLWFGDEEFPAKLRWLWDENADMYLKYETMYYAINLISKRIQNEMK